MTKRSLALTAMLALTAGGVSQAQPLVNLDLVGVGRVPGDAFDQLGAGVDTLGGIFSGMWLPDRGFGDAEYVHVLPSNAAEANNRHTPVSEILDPSVDFAASLPRVWITALRRNGSEPHSTEGRRLAEGRLGY